MGGSSEAAEVGCRIISTVDVLVVGGGPAGIGAAVGAAYHENLRVAIVDEGGCFGGAVPKSLITFAEGGVVCSGDQLLIKGVWQRIQDEMVRRGGAIPAHELIHSNKYYPFDRSRCEKDLQLTIFDPECFKLAADEILTSHPNIQPILYTRAVAPIMSGNRVTGVYVENREGRGAILAKRVIDATGMSFLLRAAGAECVSTCANAPHRQGPILVFFRAGGISEVTPTYRPNVTDVPYGAINLFPTMRDHEYRIEMTRALGDGSSVEDMTRASIECRRQIPEIIEYLRKNWYGCENIYLIDSGNEALPMSLYKLVGRRPVCVNDMLNGVVPEDTIALCGYGIDVHSAEKGGQNYLHYLEPGQYYGITDSNLNHTGIYLYSKGKIMIHLTFDYKTDEKCTTPGQYLKYHRTFQGLSTRELAEKVGIVPATLVLYENDRHPIKHSTAVALANALGIDRNRLLDKYTAFVDYPYSSLLKKVRQDLSLTQIQMAELIGIGQTSYSGWEREIRVPRRKEYDKILAALEKLRVNVDTYLCQSASI